MDADQKVVNNELFLSSGTGGDMWPRMQLRLAKELVQGFHMEKHVIYKLGFNQNDFTFPVILLVNIVMCGKNP